MRYKTFKLYSPKDIAFSISCDFEDVTQVEDAIEDATNIDELVFNLRFHTDNHLKTIEPDRETDEYVRLKLTENMCNNIKYLKIYKD